MQDKAHAQAQGKHAQTSAGHARTKGPCKHTTRTRRHGLSAKTNMLTNAQTRSSYAQAWCKARAHKKDMQCKHPGKALDVSLSLSLGITGHQKNATLDNGGKWP